MDRLTERLQMARRALETLEEVLREPKTRIVRDATIQRFEYTFEALWKAAQLYLRTVESLELGSPKAVIRAARQSGLLGDHETRAALQMADDRNLTVHTYNEDLAEAIYGRIIGYLAPAKAWLERMEQQSIVTSPR